TADVRHRHPQVLVWVNGGFIDADFVVEMRTGRTSAQSNVAENIAPVDELAGCNCKARQMTVAGRNAVRVIDHHRAPVATQEVGKSHRTICGSQNGLADRGGNIHAGVKGAFPVEWIDALPE